MDFKELFTEAKIPFNLSISYHDDAEYIQAELKKKGIDSKLSKKNAVTYVLGKVKNKTKLLNWMNDLANNNDGQAFFG